MIDPIRLLAFAFAGADLLFEVDREGCILFITGAASAFSQRAELVCSPAAELFSANEHSRFRIMMRDIRPGERVGPLPMTLASGEKASLSMCFLPEADRISCTLVKPGKRGSAVCGKDKETGLMDRDAFFAAAADNAGGRGAIAMVNAPGLPDLCAKLAPQQTANLMAGIGTNMKTMGAVIAARLSESRFGVVTNNPTAARTLADKIQNAVREQGLGPLPLAQVLLSLKGGGLTQEQNVLALRYVVSRFIEGKETTPPSTDLAVHFDKMMDETLVRAQAFNASIAEGAFSLAFEPIVDLKTQATKHYEALSRFQPGHSPAETIRFAEEMGLIDPFDMAVALKAFGLLENDSGLTASIAINISGRSMANPASFGLLAGVLSKKRALAKRVLIEVTESAEMPDLAAADKAIQTFRKMGYRVGIDDFGSGAASLQYLHAFAVDFVKVDGGLIQRLGQSPREDALLKSVLSTCRELRIDTVAEWIDSPEKLKRCRNIGFQFGQGRLFGESLAELPRIGTHSGPRAKREDVKVARG